MYGHCCRCADLEKSRTEIFVLNPPSKHQKQRQVMPATQHTADSTQHTLTVTCSSVLPADLQLRTTLCTVQTWNRLKHETCANLLHGGNLCTCLPAAFLLFFLSYHIISCDEWHPHVCCLRLLHARV